MYPEGYRVKIWSDTDDDLEPTLKIAVQIMSVAGSLTAEHKVRSVERSGRLKFRLPKGSGLTLALRVICGTGRQGGTVAERYQGGVAHRSAEAAASWWHLLSEDAVSEARAAASSGAKRAAECSSGPRRAVFERRHCRALAVPVRSGRF